MLFFDEFKAHDEEWIKWYTGEVLSYPMGEFSILDSSIVSDVEFLKLLNRYKTKSNKNNKPKLLSKNVNKKINRNKK